MPGIAMGEGGGNGMIVMGDGNGGSGAMDCGRTAVGS